MVKVLYISIASYFIVNNKQNLTVICVLHFNKYTVSIRKSIRKKKKLDTEHMSKNYEIYDSYYTVYI